jgi:hypothetical protein
VSSMMVADNHGKALRKSRRQPLPRSQAAPARSISAAKQLQTRKQPAQQAVPPGDMHRVARQARGQAIRWPVKPATETPSRPPQAAASRRQDLRQAAQPATGAGGSTQNRSPAVDRAKMSAASKPVYRVQPAPARTRTVPQQSQRASVSQSMPKSTGRPDRGPRPGPNRERNRKNESRR